MLNGIYYFSPSPNRLPYETLNKKLIKGNKVTNPRVCLLSKKVEDIKLVLNSLLKTQPENKFLNNYPLALNIEFNDEIYYGEKSLRVGYFDS